MARKNGRNPVAELDPELLGVEAVALQTPLVEQFERVGTPYLDVFAAMMSQVWPHPVWWEPRPSARA